MRGLRLVLMLDVCYLAIILIFLMIIARYLMITVRYCSLLGGYCSLLVVTACYRSLLLVRTVSMNATPLNDSFQNRLPGMSNFLLRFVKAICRKSLSFYDGDNTFQRYSAS